MTAHVFNPSTWKEVTEESGDQGQTELHSDFLGQSGYSPVSKHRQHLFVVACVSISCCLSSTEDQFE